MMQWLFGAPALGRKAELVFGCVFTFIASASAGGLLFAALELPLPVCFVLSAAIFAVMFRFKTYRSALLAPRCSWLIPAAAVAHIEFMFPPYLMSENHILGMVCLGGLAFTMMLSLLCAVLSKIDKKLIKPELFKSTLICTLPLLFTVYIFIPTELFLLNRSDFPFTLQDMLPIPIVYCAVISFTAAANLCIAGELFNRIAKAVILGLTLCVFVQNTFLNGSMPVMLGDPTDWSTFTSQKLISAAVWLAVFSAAVAVTLISWKKRPAVQTSVSAVPALICAYEILTLAILTISVGSTAFRYQLTRLSSQYQFTVSDQQNLIVFVLDETDNEVFRELYKASPEKFEVLKDFTYYDNYSTRYDSTNFALPQMITGTSELPEHNITEWYDRAFGSEQFKDFYSILHENGYLTCIYGDFMFGNQYERLNGTADNMKTLSPDEVTVYNKAIFTFMNKFSRYKYMPYLLKPSFEPSVSETKNCITFTNSSVFSNSDFLASCTLSLTEDGKKMFSLQHLNGIHYPLTTDSKVSEAALCLEMMDRYISELKRLGAYDNSMIIITGDHGTHLKAAMPVFYIKEPGKTSDQIKVDHSPVYITDLFSTCLVNAGLYDEKVHRQLFGDPIYTYNENTPRERLWFARDGFEIAEQIQRQEDFIRTNRIYGYRFTGDLAELERVTREDPPDIYLEFDSSYN